MTKKPTTAKAKPRQSLEDRIARAQRNLELLHAARQETENRRLLVIARALMAEAKANVAYMDAMREVLSRRVTNKIALAEIAPLFALVDVTPNATDASSVEAA